MPESISVLPFSAAAESALPGLLATEGLRLTPGEVRRMLGGITRLFTEPHVPDAVAAHAGAALYRFFA